MQGPWSHGLISIVAVAGSTSATWCRTRRSRERGELRIASRRTATSAFNSSDAITCISGDTRTPLTANRRLVEEQQPVLHRQVSAGARESPVRAHFMRLGFPRLSGEDLALSSNDGADRQYSSVDGCLIAVTNVSSRASRVASGVIVCRRWPASRQQRRGKGWVVGLVRFPASRVRPAENRAD